MNLPVPKHIEIINTLGQLVTKDVKVNPFTLNKYSLECDALMQTYPAQAYLGKILLGVIKSNRSEVIEFAKVASHLILATDQNETTVHNFVFALSKMAIYTEVDIRYWINQLASLTANSSDVIDASNFATGAGLLDTCMEIRDSYSESLGDDVMNHTRNIFPDALLRWKEIKQETGCDESELFRLQEIVGHIYVNRLNHGITAQLFDYDTEGNQLFSILFTEGDLDVNKVIDTNWEIAEKIAENDSPLAEHIVFTIRYS